ncbi:MAG: hypothetical protein V7607_5427 [Solirubrobacteraceae bacterium]
MSRRIDLFNPAATYGAIAGNYTSAAERWWPDVATTVVSLLDLRPGNRLLDVASGGGAVALEAGPLVTPGGSVHGLDISPDMVAIAQERAHAAGLSDAVRFSVADMHAIPFHPASFDAVSCALGLFFAKDIPEVTYKLWRLLGPDGRLCLATLGKHVFSPAFDWYCAAVDAEGVDSQALCPWTRTDMPQKVRSILQGVGLADPMLRTRTLTIPLDGPSDWSTIVQSTGIARIHQELDGAAADRVRDSMERMFARERVSTLDLEVIYTLVKKGPA